MARHIQRYGREGIPTVVIAAESRDALASKSAEANVKEQARKRRRRRQGIKEQVAGLLAHSPELSAAAVADAVNISDRRAKDLIAQLALSA